MISESQHYRLKMFIISLYVTIPRPTIPAFQLCLLKSYPHHYFSSYSIPPFWLHSDPRPFKFQLLMLLLILPPSRRMRNRARRIRRRRKRRKKVRNERTKGRRTKGRSWLRHRRKNLKRKRLKRKGRRLRQRKRKIKRRKQGKHNKKRSENLARQVTHSCLPAS